MQSGHWRFSGEAIKIDARKRLIDGQHRLQACIDANQAFETLVVVGIEPSAMDVLDTGAKRSAADALAINGYPRSPVLARAARLLTAWRNNQLGKGTSPSETLTNADIIETVACNSGIEEATHESLISSEYVRKTLGQSNAVFAFYVLSEVGGSEKARSFFTAVSSGANLSQGSPIHLLRERLTRSALGPGHKKTRLTSEEKIALVFTAWNDWMHGAEPGRLVIRRAPLSEGRRKVRRQLEEVLGASDESQGPSSRDMLARTVIQIPKPVATSEAH